MTLDFKTQYFHQIRERSFFLVGKDLLYYLWWTHPSVYAKQLITYIKAYLPSKSSENPSNQPVDLLGPCRPTH